MDVFSNLKTPKNTQKHIKKHPPPAFQIQAYMDLSAFKRCGGATCGIGVIEVQIAYRDIHASCNAHTDIHKMHYTPYSILAAWV